MSGRLAGQSAMVTGAGRGIGRAIAVRLASEGAHVLAADIDEAGADATAAAIRDAGGAAVAWSVDVTDRQSLSRLVKEAVALKGRLDIAVSNAAYSDRDYFYQADMEGFRRTVDVTMWGAFYLTRAATQQMISQGDGGIITLVSSPHAFIPAPKAMAYNMAKAALEHMARTAAIEVAEHRIRINMIQPGWIDTPGERKFASEETLETGGAKIPLGRLGTPEEIARAIIFLSDPANPYMTGATLLVDGGISLPWWAARGSAAPSE